MNDNHAVMLRRIAESARSRLLAVRETFEQAAAAGMKGRDAIAEARMHALFACEATAEIWWDGAGRTEYDVLRVAYTTRAVTRELRRLEKQQKRVTGKLLVIVADFPLVGDEVVVRECPLGTHVGWTGTVTARDGEWLRVALFAGGFCEPVKFDPAPRRVLGGAQ